MAVEFPLRVNSTKRSGLSGRNIYYLAVRETARTNGAPCGSRTHDLSLARKYFTAKLIGHMVPLDRFELSTLRLQGDCSTVGATGAYGYRGGIWTRDLQVMILASYRTALPCDIYSNSCKGLTAGLTFSTYFFAFSSFDYLVLFSSAGT